MSTKSTLAEIEDGDCVEIDYADDDRVWLDFSSSVAFHCEHREPFLSLRVRLDPATLDMIARLHAEGRFPHQKSPQPQ